MGRYLCQKVASLLHCYLIFCSLCGFVIFTYSKQMQIVRTTRWRKKICLLLGLAYLPIGVATYAVAIKPPINGHKVMFGVSSVAGYLNLCYMVLYQHYRTRELLALFNSFPNILEEVYSITHQKITCYRFFKFQLVVRFIPLTLFLLSAISVLNNSTLVAVYLFIKVVPEVVVEMFHHSVYITLYIVKEMYDNLNMSLVRSMMDKNDTITNAYLELHRICKKLNSLLTEYLLLHFLTDIVIVSSMLWVILLEGISFRKFFVIASTINKMRWLMTFPDEIAERSGFYQKVGVYHLEFYFIQVSFQLCWAYRIGKSMFLKVVGFLVLYLIVINGSIHIQVGH